MGKTLLVGAGAESALGLPTGDEFLVQSYFTKNPELYEALRTFYAGIDQSGFPAYRAEYLFSSRSFAFKELIRHIDPQALSDYLNTDLEVGEDGANPSEDQCSILFDSLIRSRDSYADEPFWQSLRIDSGHKFYGTLEPLFSSLLEPNDNASRFWRLINYYWCAYFSVFQPLLEQCGCWEDGKAGYASALDDLDGHIGCLWSQEFLDEATSPLSDALRDGYYNRARGYFDHVLTTNYTPFCRIALSPKSNDEEPIYLSGSLCQFESALDFELSGPGGRDGKTIRELCCFPFLMTRAPVKPVINADQMRVFGKAISVLEDTEELVILGFSLSPDDAHIASIIRDYVLSTRGHKCPHITYFAYHTSADAACASLTKALRLSEGQVRELCDFVVLDEAPEDTFERKIHSL